MTLSILLHGNTNRAGENKARSAVGYFQNYLFEQKGGNLGEMTWLIRHLLTPVMAAIELPVRVFQCALVTFFNLLTGSFLQSKELTESATWYNKAAAQIREENWHLLACAIGAFVSIIFDPILLTLGETIYNLCTLLLTGSFLK